MKILGSSEIEYRSFNFQELLLPKKQKKNFKNSR